MKIGSLRHKITIEEPSNASDGMGGTSDYNWTAFTENIWASIQPLSAREQYQAQQNQLEVSHKVIIRYRDGVTADMRVNFKGRVFDIQSIINSEERNVELVLLCVER